MNRFLRGVILFAAFAVTPAAGFAEDQPATSQQAASSADIVKLLDKWAQLRPGMTVDEVVDIVGPLDQIVVVEKVASASKLGPQFLQDSPGVTNMTQEISQTYSIGGKTITFKLIFNAKRKLVKYWLEKFV